MIIELPKYQAVLKNGVSYQAILRSGQPLWGVQPPVAASGVMWVGDFDNNSVTVSAMLLEGTDSVEIVAVPVDGGVEVISPPIPVDPTHKFIRTNVTGLAEGTKYNLRMRSSGGVDFGETGRVKTRPVAPEAFAFGFSSCHSATRDAGIVDTIFDTIVDQNPDLMGFYHLGDREYSDISVNDVLRYHQACDGVMRQVRVARFHRAFPLIFMWDDHDYGPNGSNGNSSIRPAAIGWFRSRVPARPQMSGASDSVYRLHSPMPGVKIAILDTRSDRFSTGMMISATQEAWLMGIIDGVQPGEALIITSGVPWVSSSETETWFGASAQRKRIADAINANCPNQVCIICGDAHMLAFDDGTNSVGGIPVYQAAPLGRGTSEKGGPYSGGVVRASAYQYARVDLTPVEGGWQFRYRGYSCDAAGVQTLRLEHTKLLNGVVAPADAAPAFTGDSTISGGTAEGETITANPGPFTGVPTANVTYQWYLDDTLQENETSATFVRPSGVGSVPSVSITLDNDIEPNAVRVVTAPATTAVSVDPPQDNAAAYQAAILALNPHFLLMGPAADGLTYPDVSGNGRNGSVVGTQAVYETDTPYGLPIFKGTSTCNLRVENAAVFNAGDWSVAFWFKPIGASVRLQGPYYRGDEEKLSFNSNGLSSMEARFAATNTATYQDIAALDDWTFAVMAYDDETGISTVWTSNPAKTIRKGGEKSVLNVRNVTTSPVTFNGRQGDRRGNIALAGMAHFGTCLTEEEVLTIYNAARGVV